MLARNATALHIAVCEGGGGRHALGMHGSRNAEWAAAVRSAGGLPAVLVVDALAPELVAHCTQAAIDVLVLPDLAAPDAIDERCPPRTAFPVMGHWVSIRLAQALRNLELGGVAIAEVEFPDRGGWGFAALQARMLEGLLSAATIAIRIEGTRALRASYRAEARTLSDLMEADLERKALADCDVLRAESVVIVESVLGFHGFVPAEWEARTECAASLAATSAAVPDRAPAFNGTVFCWIDERSTAPVPTLARALSGIAGARPDWTGAIILLGCPKAAAAVVERLPGPVRRRTEWRQPSMHENPFDAGPSIWLDADAWSASSVLARSAAARGALCVVPDANPAYSHPAWTDGRTCLRHDGSANGMVAALQRAFEVPLQAKVTAVAVHRPVRMRVDACGHAEVPHPPRITVIVPHHNLGSYLAETVESAQRCTPAGTEIIVVDDASDDAASRRLIDDWRRTPPLGVRVLQLPFNVGLGAARNAGVDAASGDFILPLDADDLLAPGFAARAAAALQRHPGFDFVVAQAAYFERSPGAGGLPAPTGYVTFVGDARESGLHANRFSTASCLMRRRAALELRYREDLDAYEDWDLYQRASMEGRRFIVDAGIGLFYRRRPTSMIHAPAMRARHATLQHCLLAKRRIAMEQVRMSGQALEAAVVYPMREDAMECIDATTLTDLMAELNGYRNSRSLRGLLWLGALARRCRAALVAKRIPQAPAR